MNPGRLLRTVRHIRPAQAVAQAAYLLRGRARPLSAGGTAELRVPRGHTHSLGAPHHARWDGGRRIELIGRSVAFRDQIDWDFADEGPLWAYHLHQFDYARSASSTPEARGALLLDWIERHPRGTGWNPHPISLRIVSWGRLLTQPGGLPTSVREAVVSSLADQIETLSRHPEIRLQANHLFSNWLGVLYGGLLLRHPRADVWRRRGRALERELERQIGRDGLHEERSPMYHALLLENVLDLLNLARAVAGSDDPPGGVAELVDRLCEVAGRMLGALAVLTHPDGEIALFADSSFGVAHPPAVLSDYARRLGVSVVSPDRAGVLPDGGYARVEAGPFTAIASLSGPAPAHQPGHAHCDFLAFELSCGGERVVTDSGVPEYIPGALREACRSVRAHATLEIEGHEPAEIWGGHRVGGRPVVSAEPGEPLVSASGRCAGWSTRDTEHRREWRRQGGLLEITDHLTGRARAVRARLPLAPGIEVRLESGTDATLHLCLPSGRRVRVGLPSGLRYRTERAPYFPEFGCRLERPCVVGEADAWSGGTWSFAADARG